MSSEKKTGSTALWYFVAATFAAALGHMLLSPEPGHWATSIWIGLALVLVVLGGIVLGMEVRARRSPAD